MFPAYNNNLSNKSTKQPLFPSVSEDKVQLEQDESKNISINRSYSSYKVSYPETSSNILEKTKLVEFDSIEKEHKMKKKKREKDSKKKHKKPKKKKKRSNDSISESSTEKSSSEDEQNERKKKIKKQDDDVDFQYKSQSYKNNFLEKLLCDEIYNSYYSKFTRDQLKSYQFLEDFPNLDLRNAFKIDKKGDKNNMCFDQVNFKYLCKYYVPYLRGESRENSKANKHSSKLTKKQLRKKLLSELREKRYYSKVKNISETFDESKLDDKKKKINVDDLSKNALSNKMWLYLEMKSELEREYETIELNKIDKTSDYMKYLDEHKNDIDKWLEFIDYQTNKENTEENYIDLKNRNSIILFERKMAIFDKAIQENANNFRLKLERLKFKSNSFEILNSYNALEIIENDYLDILINESSNIIMKSLNQSMQNQILSNLFEIWFEYLKFLTNTNSSSITFNKIKSTYQKCFEYFLSSESNELIRKNSNNTIFFNLMLQLLDNYCSFLCKNGYIEKAIGIYQAMIDFNFNSFSRNEKSPYNNIDFKFKKTLFELFWDTGLSKFGEKHSIGWLNCLENRDQVFKNLENDNELAKYRYDDQLDSIETRILTWQNLRVEYRWYEIERLRSLINWYPFYPQIVLGESADDCADQDRLISYEDDLSFVLFDLNNLAVHSDQNQEETIDLLKFKLFCKLLKTLNLISWNEECLNLNSSQSYLNRLINSSKTIDDGDGEYMRYLNEQIDYLSDQKSINRQDIQCCGNFNFLHNLIFNLADSYQSDNFRSYTQAEIFDLKNIIKSVLLNTIEFVRNCFNQIEHSFKTLKFKTNVRILKWKFELTLENLLKCIPQDINEEKLNHKNLKQNLLEEAKLTLSLSENRMNFQLWKQYGILKWLLNNETQSQTINLKETRKVFDNLLNIISDNVDVYSLCSDYVQLELGIYYNQYDVNTSNLDEHVISYNQISLSTISIQNGFFNLKQEHILKLKGINMNNLIELLVTHCSNRSTKQDNQTKLKEKVTFKIGMTGTTKLLLAKRDFQIEYELMISESKSKKCDLIKLYHFHKVYSLFLLCTNDFEKLLEINDNMVLKETVLNLYQSMVIEFYLNILNYLYFQEKKLTKFMFKTKLFTIIRATLSTSNNFDSYLRLLQLTLLRLKLQNSSLFCNEILENSDIDLMFDKIALKLSNSKITSQQMYSSSFSLTQIYSHLKKLNEIIKDTCTSEKDSISSLFSLDIQQHGYQNKIRRLFEQALKINPKSIELWLYYFKFEFVFVEQNKFFMNKQQMNNFQNRVLYIYYQSIRNLPYCKLFYINGIKSLPDKYIEIMNLMSNKELRVYFPIQELNMLLEPIKKPGELEIENDYEMKDESEIYSLNSCSSKSSLNENDDEESEELIDSNDEEKTNDSSSISSNSSVSNFNLKDL